ncbi:MAG TPA: hypothetical protein VFJ58_28080 [Armatimonadota bacterium]|nr:hypothetical protein [Armatimonadota bacterium]
MWDEDRRQRFRKLREQELHTLTSAERTELDELVAEIEAEEARYLHAATGRIEQETEAFERRNQELQALIIRKESLLWRLRSVLAEAQNEREAMRLELKRILRETSPVEMESTH